MTPTERKRLRRHDPRAALYGDAALAAVLAVVSCVGTLAARDGTLRWTTLALLTASSAALALHRRHPMAATLTVIVLACVYILGGHPLGPNFLLPAVALYSYAFHAGTRRAALVLTLSTAALVVSLDLSEDGIASLAWTAVFLLILVILPLFSARLRRSGAEAREHARAVERENQRTVERVAIARDIHDAVGHSLAVVNMNAQVALHQIDSPGSDPREHLTAIRDASARALADLRQTVALLRQGADPGGPDVRTLSDLPELLADIERAGVRVDYRAPDGADTLPTATTTTAYRVVQESLTNALRHSSAREVAVHLSVGPDLEVEVSDPGPAKGNAAGGGRGIAGMRARVESLGGTLSAGPAGEGFRVRAAIPTEETRP